MPRLPTLDDLGSRPVPQSRRGIATVRNADAIGDAVEGLGKTIAKAGTDLLEQQDKFDASLAKSALLTADAKARDELSDDPNYGTFDARYRKQMSDAVGKAGKVIRSASARRQFEADANSDIERGATVVAALARSKRVDAEQGALLEGLDGFRLAARDAPDEPTAMAALQGANTLIASARAKGTIDAVKEVELRTGFTSNHVEDQFRLRYNAGDVDGAKSYLDRHRSMLQWQKANEFDAMLKNALDFRQRESDADWAIGIETRGEGGAPVPYADPLRGKSRGVVPGGQFGADRGGSTHNGVDFAAPAGTPVYSIGAGTVVEAKFDPRAGNHVVIDHGGGRTSSYSHLASLDLKPGEAVSPDTVVGKVGMTGHTTGPHLHLVVRDDGKLVNPQTVIGRAQQSPRQHDLAAAYAAVDQRADSEGWTPERRERAKEAIDDRVRRDELLLRRDQQQAMTRALDKVDSLGAGFTDVAQLGDTSGLSPEDRLQLQGMARQNRAAQAPKANGDMVTGLHAMVYYDPDGFKALDLRTVRPFVTPAEFDDLMKTQADLRTRNERSPIYVQHERIWGTISRYAPDIGLTMGQKAKDQDRADANRIFGMMKRDLDELTKGERAPTDDEVKAAFDRATIQVKVVTPGRLWGENVEEARRYQVPEGQTFRVAVPNEARTEIISRYRARYGKDPSEQVVAQTYMQFKGQLWK